MGSVNIYEMTKIQDTNLTYIDSAIQALPDTFLVTGSINISDTLRVIDAGKDSEYPLSLIAVIVAILAIVIPPITRWINEIFHRRNLRKYTLHVSHSLIKGYGKRIKIFKKLAKQIGNIDELGYEYTRSMGYIAQNLLNIPQNDLFRLFVSRRKSKTSQDYNQFKELFDAIAFFVNHEEEAYINFTQFFSDIRRYQAEFKNNMNTILRLNDHYRSVAAQNNIGPNEDLFLREIDEILGAYSNLKNNVRYDITMTKFITPLKKVTIKHLADERSVLILDRIVDCNSAFSEILNVKEIYSAVYFELAKTLKKKRKLMVIAIDYFEQPR